MKQAAFLADGASDLPLGSHLGSLCAERGVEVIVTPVDQRLLPSPDRTVRSRLQSLLEQGDGLDIVFIHRDAEGQPPELRREEINRAAMDLGLTIPIVSVVPVRMTEAWLLLDEQEIRTVAGRPRGTAYLDLPKVHQVEGIADPKALLRDLLLTASETVGRRREQFKRDFGRHRSLLIQRLNLSGQVRELAAWVRLEADLDEALTAIS